MIIVSVHRKAHRGHRKLSILKAMNQPTDAFLKQTWAESLCTAIATPIIACVILFGFCFISAVSALSVVNGY